jgi:molybdopterin synthase catalytic subunit
MLVVIRVHVNVKADVLIDRRADVGALGAFTGLCRDEGGRILARELERYPGMAETEITRMALQATCRWPLLGLTATHRIGKISPAEEIVLVVAANAHRHTSFDAAEFLMVFLKSHAPFWKREHLTDGAMGACVSAKDGGNQVMEWWDQSL